MTDKMTDKMTDFQLVDSIPSARRDRVKKILQTNQQRSESRHVQGHDTCQVVLMLADKTVACSNFSAKKTMYLPSPNFRIRTRSYPHSPLNYFVVSTALAVLQQQVRQRYRISRNAGIYRKCLNFQKMLEFLENARISKKNARIS